MVLWKHCSVSGPTANAGKPDPYRQAIVAALRDLTGQNAEPTGEAWRQRLDLQAGQTRASLR